VASRSERLAELRAALAELEAGVAQKVRAVDAAAHRERGSRTRSAVLDSLDDAIEAPPSIARRLRRPLRVLATWLRRVPTKR
jgi:hypothetical protein